MSVVDAKNADVALTRLRKLRKCPEDKEELITHLVLGAERTTFKARRQLHNAATCGPLPLFCDSIEKT